MAKHKFTAAEKLGVWQAFDGQCFWCGKPVAYTDTTVDHVIPETVEDKPAQLDEIRRTYGLGASFEINSFRNWVPCHGSCNSSKGSRLYGPSPAMIAYLEFVARKAESAANVARRATEDREKGRILGKLESALEANLITREEVMVLIGDLDPRPMIPGTQPALQLLPGWSVVRGGNGFVTVTDGVRAGIAPTDPNPHISWQCPTCGQFGPWNGVICLSCGQRSDPWD
jgi:5-methylcytosine-specific restriction endonuclease McrA